MYLFEKSYSTGRQILASEHYISFTCTIKKEDVEPNDEGRRIVPAGTVFPKNDATAKGLILNDVDVTYGNQPAPLLVEGYVYKGRLPEDISEEAKAVLPKISYRETYNE